MVTTVACTCGPTSIVAHRKCRGWCLALIVAAHAAGLPIACLKSNWKPRCTPCGNARCHSRPIARTGSTADLKMEQGSGVGLRPGAAPAQLCRQFAGSCADQVFENACGRYGTTAIMSSRPSHALRSHAMPDRNLEARLKRCAPGQITRSASQVIKADVGNIINQSSLIRTAKWGRFLRSCPARSLGSHDRQPKAFTRL